MSVPRSDAASAVVGDHMYVCGGLDVSLRQHNSVERFDTLSEVWEAQPAMAQKRFKARAAVIRKRIYVVGGFSNPTTCSVERFDGAWTTVPPVTRCPCSTAVIAQKLYVCGGEDGRAANTLERLDPSLQTWELLRPPLHRRRLTTVADLRDSLYFDGGVGDDGVDIVLDSVESYDTVTDSWEESAPLLNARCVAKVARVNGALFIFGGFGQELDELASVERFDLVTGRWEALPDMTVTGDSLVAAIHA